MSNEDIIYSDITYEELVNAYLSCRKHKRWTKSALKFELNLSENLNELYNDLITGNYKISPSIAFIVHDPKDREVFAASFRDRIVHHLLINRLYDKLESYYHDASYNCRIGRGSLNAAKKLQWLMITNQNHKIIGLDLRAFFMSINRELTYNEVIEFINNNIESDKLSSTIFLANKVLTNDPTKNCIKLATDEEFNKIPKHKSLFDNDKGYPIGDLTTQFIANLILTKVDKYISSSGFEHVRYVDDFRIVVPNDPKIIKNTINNIMNFINISLGVEFNRSKIIVQSVSHGTPFIGYLVTIYGLYPGRYLKYRINYVCTKHYILTKDKIIKIFQSVNSYLGLLKHCIVRHPKFKLLSPAIKLNVGFYMKPNQFRLRMTNQLKLKLYN